MNKPVVVAVCFLICLHASFAGAQTAAPHPDLETADWSIKQARSLNAEPKDVVWKLMGHDDSDPGNGKLCSFQFADLRHSGQLSLAVTYDNGGTGDCNDFDVFDKTAAGIEDYDFGADPVFDDIEDIDGDGRHELVVDRSFASIGRDHCTATWPVIYAWNGSGYADVSGQFKDFYRHRLQELTRQLAPSPTRTPVAEQPYMVEGQPLDGRARVRLGVVSAADGRNFRI
jgi:hypothetical protein